MEPVLARELAGFDLSDVIGSFFARFFFWQSNGKWRNSRVGSTNLHARISNPRVGWIPAAANLSRLAPIRSSKRQHFGTVPISGQAQFVMSLAETQHLTNSRDFSVEMTWYIRCCYE
jgi:hypothetical protein